MSKRRRENSEPVNVCLRGARHARRENSEPVSVCLRGETVRRKGNSKPIYVCLSLLCTHRLNLFEYFPIICFISAPLDDGLIAGIAAGSVVAFILIIAITIMCFLIAMKSRTPPEVKPPPPRSNKLRTNLSHRPNRTLTAAPHTISYGRPERATDLTTVGTPSPFSGLAMIEATDSTLVSL